MLSKLFKLQVVFLFFHTGVFVSILKETDSKQQEPMAVLNASDFMCCPTGSMGTGNQVWWAIVSERQLPAW